jgi:hypothetical protein
MSSEIKDYSKFGKTVLTNYINDECERRLFLELSRNYKELWINPIRKIKKPKFIRSDKSAKLGKDYEQKVYEILGKNFACINKPRNEKKVSASSLSKVFLERLYSEMNKNDNERVLLLEFEFKIPDTYFLDIFKPKSSSIKIPIEFTYQRPDIIILENYLCNIEGKSKELMPNGRLRTLPKEELDKRHGISIIDIKYIKDENIGKRQFVEIFYYLRTLSYYLRKKGLLDKYYVKIDSNGILPSIEKLEELGKKKDYKDFMQLIVPLSWNESIRIYNKVFDSIKKLWGQAPCSIESIPVNIQPTCGYCNFIEDCKCSLGMVNEHKPEEWSVRLLPYTEQSVAEKLIEKGYKTIGDVEKKIKDFEVGITPEAIYSELPLLELKAKAIIKERSIFPEKGKTHVYALPRYTPISLVFAVETDPMFDKIFAVALYFNMYVHPNNKYHSVFAQWWREWKRALQQNLNPQEIKAILDPILFHEISIEEIESFLDSLKFLKKFQILLPGDTLKESVIKQTRTFYQFSYINQDLTQNSEVKLGKKIVKRLHDIIEISNIVEKYVGIEDEYKGKKYWTSPLMGIYYWGSEQYENFQKMLQRHIDEFISDEKIINEFTEVISWIAPSDSEVKHPYQHKKIFDLQKFIETILGFPCVINYTWHEIAEKELDIKSNKKYWAQHFNYMDFGYWHELIAEKNRKKFLEKFDDIPKEVIEESKEKIDKQSKELKKQIRHKVRQINNILSVFQRNARPSISRHAHPMKITEFQSIPLDSNFHSIAQVWYLYSKLNGTTSEMDVELIRTNFPEFGIAKLRIAEVKDFGRTSYFDVEDNKIKYFFDIVGLSTNVKMGEGDRVLLIPDEMRDIRVGNWTRQWIITIEKMIWDSEINGYKVMSEETKNNVLDLYEASSKYQGKKTKWYLYPISMDVWSTKLHNRNGLLERKSFGISWLGKRLSYLWRIRATQSLVWPDNWIFNSANVYLYSPEIILEFQKKKSEADNQKLISNLYPKPDPSQEHAILKALNNIIYAIKGPPGTGKSQTIAALVDEYLTRRKKNKKNINRILITAFSYSAIRVLINKLRNSLDISGNPTITAKTQMIFLRSPSQKAIEDHSSLRHVDDLVRIGSAWRWNDKKRIITSTKTLEEQLENNVIIFGNAHQLYHLEERVYPTFSFDLILVDEASQVPVDQAMSFLQFIKNSKFHLKPEFDNPIEGKEVESPKSCREFASYQ